MTAPFETSRTSVRLRPILSAHHFVNVSNRRYTPLILKYIVFTVEKGSVCWAGVENIDDLRPLAPGSQGRVLSPTRQIDPPAAKFMTNSIKITKRLSEIKNDKKC